MNARHHLPSILVSAPNYTKDIVPLSDSIVYEHFPERRQKRTSTPPWCVFWAQIDTVQSAPLIFTTPFCENRYQKIAALAERCYFICEFSPPFCHNGVKCCIFSILHKGFTAFAYRIRAPPSEVLYHKSNFK